MNNFKYLLTLKKHCPENEKIIYGIECIYIIFTKSIIILIFALLLGILKNLLLIVCCFNILRSFSFGLHFKNSISCMFFSCFLFFGFSFMANIIIIPKFIFIICMFIAFICFFIYAPADTIKRPLISIKTRKKYHLFSQVILIFYMVLYFLIKNQLIQNCMFFSLILQTILILPITYKLFNYTYNNYKTYIIKGGD